MIDPRPQLTADRLALRAALALGFGFFFGAAMVRA